MAGVPPTSSCSSADLLQLLADGDEAACAIVFERYVERLTQLVSRRLAARLAQRLDAEDIVMSAYRSFFVGARQQRFTVIQGGDLWRLLVEVTLHKLYRSARQHSAQRRAVKREQSVDVSGGSVLVAPEPTPEEAAIASEMLQAVLSRLSPRSGQALELRLQGFEHQEIADRLACNERTVRRALNEARRIFATLGGDGFIPSAARRGARHPAGEAAGAADVTPTVEPSVRWADYLLREQIGTGSTGKVYRAVERRTGRLVAVKFLKKALSGSRSMMERFVHEAQTVAELALPGIVPVRGLGRTPGGGLFLVMDLVEGSDLALLHASRSIEHASAVAWVVEAARVIHAAHQRGVIHCDLKPANLLLDRWGRLFVTDFGLAVRSEDSVAGLLAGTPAFMAPEQVDSVWGPVSPRTDLWGLAAVLYFLFSGRPPHTGCDIPSVMAQIVSAAPVSFLDGAFETVPAEWLAPVRRCLEKRPEDRFATAQELADALTPKGAS